MPPAVLRLAAAMLSASMLARTALSAMEHRLVHGPVLVNPEFAHGRIVGE